MENKNVYVVTPVLNEAENIPTLVEGWKKITQLLNNYNFKFILVDDGSTDNTGEICTKLAGNNQLNFKLLSHPQNMGPGYAFATGFEYLSSVITNNDLVVTIEGDNTSRIETLKIMIERILRENIDVALASPYSYGGTITNTKWYRIILSHAASVLTKVILGIRGIHTFTSFFRVYQGRVIIKLQKNFGPRIIEFRGFECMVELLKKITLFEFSITEVPMKLDTSQRKGKSKLKILKTMFAYFILFLKSKEWKVTRH